MSQRLLSPCRTVTGISEVLLPFVDKNGNVDWQGFENQLEQIFSCGLFPAVNMDAGFVGLIGVDLRDEVLQRTQRIASGQHFFAGAFVSDQPGAGFDLEAYQRSIADIAHYGGVPILFQSFGLTEQSDEEIIDSYHRLSWSSDQYIAYEMEATFADYGKIYSTDVFRELLHIGSCVGMKHASLDHQGEFERLELRNQIRPDFKVFTGNDLSIDMVRYGSDYSLGSSAFAPDLFALRDKYWREGNDRFHQLNDLLQHLATFGFRDPTAAYKHTAAMILEMQGIIACDATHPDSPKRPDGDRKLLGSMLASLSRYRD
ncbi:dihydrodipicolinate synthase family protein [bacterium]|nr:dihydrodipicolinate synthase family protein [bacterium]